MANTSPHDGAPMDWQSHIVRIGPYFQCPDGEPDPEKHREQVEPWLSALFQAEHLNVLVGSGLTTAVARSACAPVVDMSPATFQCGYADAVQKAARQSAERLGRKEPNIEDQARTVIELIGGLRILSGGADAGNDADVPRPTDAALLQAWESELDNALSSLLKKVLATERGIHAALTDAGTQRSERVRRLLGGFLLPYCSAGPRPRRHLSRSGKFRRNLGRIRRTRPSGTCGPGRRSGLSAGKVSREPGKATIRPEHRSRRCP